MDACLSVADENLDYVYIDTNIDADSYRYDDDVSDSRNDVITERSDGVREDDSSVEGRRSGC